MDDSSSESSSGDENIPIQQLLRMPIQSEMLSDESSSEDDILLSKEEHDSIRAFEPDLFFVKTYSSIVDIVTKHALSLLQPLIYQFEMCVMDRIPPLFHLLRKCFDFSERFKILSDGRFEEYVNFNIDSLSQLAAMENEFLKLDSSATLFDEATLRKESDSALRKLAIIYNKKIAEFARIEQLLTAIETQEGHEKRNAMKREVEELKENSWWVWNGKVAILNELRVIKTMRTEEDIWRGNSSYMRLLTRAAVRRPSETIVEQLISIIGDQVRENLDWSKLLTEVQFRTFGPYAHEWDNLLDMMYKILHEDQKMRCIVRYPGLREKRSSHLKGSVSTTRLMNRKSKFQGFNKKL